MKVQSGPAQQPAAGWYPDPGGSPHARWWDGTRWTALLQPVSPTPSSKGRRRAADLVNRPRRGIAWSAISVFALAVVIIGVALLRGQPVKTVKIGGLVAEFDATQVQQVEQNQEEIAEVGEQYKSEAKGEAAAQEPISGPDLTGVWLGADGLQYNIAQYGSAIFIEELSPYGVTGVGQGSIDGRRVTFEFTAVDGSRGSARLTLKGASTLNGVAQSATGYQTRVDLRKT